MFRKILFSSLISTLFLTNFSLAYDYLSVRDPKNWHSTQGTIETAVISVRPQGLYMEIGLYLTFSARGWYYNSTDSLEVEFYFDLPENSIVHDSWLWIGNDIIRGKIMDKWTASQIYEDIVKRRRDPSILFKRGENNYELRIYPMLASETRKVKLTYLLPAQWNSNNILASLPTNLLRTSKYDVSTFYLLTWLDDEWKNPRILEFPEISFGSHSDSTFGKYIRADITPEAIESSIHFSLSSPLNEGIYFNSYNSGSEGIYQLAFLPSEALSLSTSSKVAVLFDYDASNCDIESGEILNTVKSVLHSYFSEKDSFNLIFSKLNIHRASEVWLPADSTTIENTFSNLGESPISSYSNLPTLLANGVEFVKENGDNGSIVLISSSDQVGDYTVANQLIDDILEIMDTDVPIHVADFQDRNYSYYYIAGRSYYGNEYFYTNISRLTTANFFSIRSGYNFTELISTTLSSISGFISSFDLHTTLQSGYCYSRYNLNNQKSSIYLDKPILQIGKYNGDFPFVIEASGVYESEVFSQQFEINEENINISDSLSEEAWTGNYIEYLEGQEQTNDVVNEIIDYSIGEKVLSIYSAFLCLEPSRGGEICYDCMDESELVAINEQWESNKNDSLLTAYPNPFNQRVNIKLNIPSSEINENTTIKIYNLLGQVVKTLDLQEDSNGKVTKFTWNGKNNYGIDVSSGTYFFVVNTTNKRYSLKLIYMK
jgi:hypothetical protein